MHWHDIFVPVVSPLEIILPGTIMYLSLFIILRVILKRQTSNFGLSDVLLIVLIADAAQNGMSGEYKSVPDGLLLVGTLAFWNYALDFLAQYSKAFERLTSPPPLKLVDQGKPLMRNMRHELITMDELMEHLRESGLDNVKQVKAAYMEGDGSISVIPLDGKQATPTNKHKRV